VGWLRDLMKAARPAPRSFDDLARQCLQHASWPAEFRIRERSFGALLGKFDRELELDWLAQRPGAQRTLALVLGTSREQVLDAISPKRAAPGRYVRLDDLPAGRLLDLNDELLYPGLPAELFTPGQWDGLWWQTPSGSGRTLVGRWLRARGLLPPAELEPRSARTSYVELSDDTWIEPRPGLCVASPLPPRASGFRVIESAPLATSLDALVDWAAARLPEGGDFDRAELVRFVSALVERRAIESAGAVLGLVGLADEHGVAELVRRTPRQLMSFALRRRAGELLDPESPATHWMKRSSADALIALLRQALTDADQPWWHERTLGDWSELLPAELRREADVEWLSVSLTGAGSAIRPSDVERAARELPPGAFRLLRAFERTGVLARGEGEGLALRPHWLVELGLNEALQELAQSTPGEWGEALLRPHAAARVARAVVARTARAEAALIEDVSELEPSESPALCAATELAFRAVGLSVLASGEMPGDGAEQLWKQALELCVIAPGETPRPRIEYAVGQGLLARGSYYLAAWALSEALPSAPRATSPALYPWAGAAPAAARALLDEVQYALEALPELTLPAALLVGRLPGGGEPQHALELPSALVSSGKLDTWNAVLQRPLAARVVAELMQSDAGLAQRLWRDWETSGRATLPAPASSELFAPFWRHAPRSALEALLERDELDFTSLSAEQWRVVVDALLRRRTAPPATELWVNLPARELVLLLDAALWPDDAACLRLIWKREPELMMRALESSFFEQPTRGARALLASVPDAQSAELAARLSADARLGSLTTQRLWELQAFLHGRVGERGAGWRAAYAALARLERRLAGVRRTSL
jgi:hypothetical protein